MFIKSAATDTLQGRAIHAVNQRWGEDCCQRNGRETIGIPVCKKKYAPFQFKIVTFGGKVQVTVERVFGCHCHSKLRKRVIEQHGCRPGWEPFGQWSMRKALEKARVETERLNNNSEGETTDEGISSCDENTLSICHNGKCAWKLKEKYDDIHSELRDSAEQELVYAKHYPPKR